MKAFLLALVSLSFIYVTANDDVVCQSDTDARDDSYVKSVEIGDDGNIHDINIAAAAAESETSYEMLYDNDIDGPKSDETVETAIETNPREMSVIFRNKSGQRVKLWWKGFDGNNVIQAVMNSPEDITINTFWSHEFFFTPYDNEDEILYSVRMENHVELIQLLTPTEMAQRDKEFEAKKNQFYKDYYQRTGRTWKNYYPREPVTHFMYNLENEYNINDTIQPTTNHMKYVTCPSSLFDYDEFNAMVNKLREEENEYKQNEFAKLDEERVEYELNNLEDRDWFRHVPAYKPFTDEFEMDGNNVKVTLYNGTLLCQDYNSKDNVIDMRVLCNSEPRVVSINNFLSEEECDHIIEVGNYIGLRRSTVSESALKSADRTSSTVWLERIMSPVVDTVVQRIGDALGIDGKLLYLNASSESLQFVHYLGGELYKPHHDYGTDMPNNRFITFLMYLNDVGEGGYTSFPNANKVCKNDDNYFGVKPRKGNAAWFYDLYSDGNVDPSTLHYAEPPLNGSEKYMTNLWIWDPFFK